ncbi:hypothetical protein TTHERM_001050493 (macronuclear) [Tetrahymena thermophila SB210]|uniref:Uncharacterized protein n=1 Tax=Tetrahymena thermophila (strain SB210) TaxID=312017 RepID=W7XE14_TETTS|nr:hypothetical protein TTHERM_001050493 [Tetrahymena thermophila SB210]EWS75867.1 hypothetical protein TTHERM_001050493 [Tetrahymena thermophila SB210]|eukprot:XP_012651602.1 hypothetical protein TTHERM_001050493 [Tetrahymena thermophila SB210]
MAIFQFFKFIIQSSCQFYSQEEATWSNNLVKQAKKQKIKSNRVNKQNKQIFNNPKVFVKNHITKKQIKQKMWTIHQMFNSKMTNLIMDSKLKLIKQILAKINL